jgi:DNA-directed RNA polymerase subunit K/omega
VLGVAKRARDISDKPDYQRKLSTKKPVKLAIEELHENKYKIITTGMPKELDRG